jgi:hypothetical protein
VLLASGFLISFHGGGMHNNESDGGPGAAMTKDERDAAEQILALLTRLPGDGAERVLAHVQDMLDAHDAAGPAFSRGIAGPLGKLDCELKTKVDEHTHTLFLQQCAMQRTTTSNEIRNCIYALTHGKSYDQMIVERLNHDAKRTQALAKLIGPFGGPEFGGTNGEGATA